MLCYTDLVSREKRVTNQKTETKKSNLTTKMKNQIIASFEMFNKRRYSSPYVCKMGDNGTYNFDDRVGVYTGNGREGEAGDLVVFEPVVGQVYGYEQKDYRGGNTMKNYAKWDGEKFVPCDILGREIAA